MKNMQRRGRPRHNRPMHDTGTPELVMKRLRAETVEVLDLLLDKAIITPEQHWCGIHLRWLYTLRFGAPGVRAIDTTHLGGMEISTDDPAWRMARETEYADAVNTLGSRRWNSVLSASVYNERPAMSEVEQLQDALQLLVKHWCRRAKK